MKATRPFQLTAPVSPEFDLHVAVGDALNYLLPPNVVFTSWDLANAKSAVEGARRKRRYCIAGFPDMGVFYNGRVVLLELKRSRGGYLSPAQRALHPRLEAAGHPVAVCHSVIEALNALAAAGVPLRGRVAA